MTFYEFVKFNNNNNNKLFSKFQRLIPSQQGTRVYRKTVKELQYVQSEAASGHTKIYRATI